MPVSTRNQRHGWQHRELWDVFGNCSRGTKVGLIEITTVQDRVESAVLDKLTPSF